MNIGIISSLFYEDVNESKEISRRNNQLKRFLINKMDTSQLLEDVALDFFIQYPVCTKIFIRKAKIFFYLLMGCLFLV